MIKKHYEAPESEQILVKFENDFMQGSNDPTPGAAGGIERYNEYKPDF